MRSGGQPLNVAMMLCAEGGRLLRDGHFGAAQQRFRQALAMEPRNFNALSGLGLIALEHSQFDQAISYLKQACTIGPQQIAPRINLGNALARVGRYDEAIAAYDAALRLNGNDVEAVYNRATALLYGERLAEAVDGYRRVLAIAPDHGNALFNLATAHCRLGQFEAAADACRRLLPQAPNELDVLTMLLDALGRCGSIDDAQAPMAHAVDVAKAAIDAAPFEHEPLGQKLVELGRVLISLDEPGKALALFDHAIAKFTQSPELLVARGRALTDMMRQPEAVASFDRALALRGEMSGALMARGVALVHLGQFDVAIDSYERAMRAGGPAGDVMLDLSVAKTFRRSDDPHLKTIDRLLWEREALSPTERMHLHFAAGKAYDDLGRHDEAFSQWQAGNRMKRQLSPYDVEIDIRFGKDLAATFDNDWMAARLGKGAAGAPIFVFGMARSGTTLVEQLIGAHPEAAAIGEAGAFQRAVRETLRRRDAGTTSLEKVRSLSVEEQAEIGIRYLNSIRERGGGASRLVDKTLGSSQSAGLIAAALPGAMLIHVRRDRLDNALGCYSKLFVSAQDFSYDLGDFGRYRLSHDALMRHWRHTLPADRFLEIDYEALVSNFEAEARKLIAFCGLPWTEKVLDFARVRRAVNTASAFQVRQGLFSSSVGRWKNYDKHLAGLAHFFEQAQPGAVAPC